MSHRVRQNEFNNFRADSNSIFKYIHKTTELSDKRFDLIEENLLAIENKKNAKLKKAIDLYVNKSITLERQAAIDSIVTQANESREELKNQTQKSCALFEKYAAKCTTNVINKIQPPDMPTIVANQEKILSFMKELEAVQSEILANKASK